MGRSRVSWFPTSRPRHSLAVCIILWVSFSLRLFLGVKSFLLRYCHHCHLSFACLEMHCFRCHYCCWYPFLGVRSFLLCYCHHRYLCSAPLERRWLGHYCCWYPFPGVRSFLLRYFHHRYLCLVGVLVFRLSRQCQFLLCLVLVFRLSRQCQSRLCLVVLLRVVWCLTTERDLIFSEVVKPPLL